MAPIPLKFDEETSNLVAALERRKNDIESFQVPRLRDCKGPLSAQQQLAQELREDLDIFTSQIEKLEIHVEELARKALRLAVTELVEQFRESCTRLRKEMRAALLHSKKVIDSQSSLSEDRKELLRGAIDTRNVEDKATDDALMKASNDVTDALRRTLGLMQSELERSVLSHQILEKSNQTLLSTSTQHDILTHATQTSKTLITALSRADTLDRLLIGAALVFFWLVVLFVIKERVVDRGLRGVGGVVGWAGYLVGLGSGGGGSGLVSGGLSGKGIETGTKALEKTAEVVSTAVSVVVSSSAAAAVVSSALGSSVSMSAAASVSVPVPLSVSLSLSSSSTLSWSPPPPDVSHTDIVLGAGTGTVVGVDDSNESTTTSSSAFEASESSSSSLSSSSLDSELGLDSDLVSESSSIKFSSPIPSEVETEELVLDEEITTSTPTSMSTSVPVPTQSESHTHVHVHEEL